MLHASQSSTGPCGRGVAACMSGTEDEGEGRVSAAWCGGARESGRRPPSPPAQRVGGTTVRRRRRRRPEMDKFLEQASIQGAFRLRSYVRFCLCPRQGRFFARFGFNLAYLGASARSRARAPRDTASSSSDRWVSGCALLLCAVNICH